ncbi:MAG TPA: thioredoxin domain-containing protein, partial [Bacteroidia bacterium]|nr:thioredoxin domain-containing protein [Bacteroidia bacterium]
MHTNRLIHESSPYLLQHAHNPVDWFAWGNEALAKAKTENKLILISVGYSACHWCHVMEHESFEDEKVARIMNDLFVCIKVDREERPDIDQVYMTAVQLMTGHGGWPLNCFALPDARPLYGGTYFPNERWIEILLTLADLWKGEPEKCFQYANELTEGVKKADRLIADKVSEGINDKALGLSVEQWSARFDNTEGGPARAPKFPLPNNYFFLLRYAHLAKKENLLKHVRLTLDKMAMGGIYDQLGGGFTRYSTDMLWKVPHFEKMLYDNGQLVSLYSEAFRATKDPLYREIVFETLQFVARELTHESGAFFSALDADSEGEEGKYYVWSRESLEELLGDDFKWFGAYYNINMTGAWEGNYILLRREKDEEFAMKHGMTPEELKVKVARAKALLLPVRERRVRPGLDDKTLTSWNAIMLRGYVDAFETFGEDEFLLAALKNARFIVKNQLREDGGLWHSWKNGKSTINGFLEDYAFVIDAFLALYQVTFDEQWMQFAGKLSDYTLTHFDDAASGMFFFTSDQDAPLIARKTEIQDNVIPASNSVMARNLFYLGHFLGNTAYIERSARMLSLVQQDIIGYGGGYSNWMILQLHFEFPFREVAIVGNSV